MLRSSDRRLTDEMIELLGVARRPVQLRVLDWIERNGDPYAAGDLDAARPADADAELNARIDQVVQALDAK
jgi:hypothetical protein